MRERNRSGQGLDETQKRFLRQRYGELVDQVRVAYGSSMMDEWCGFGKCTPTDSAAQTYCDRIYVRDPYKPNDADQLVLLAHEMRHSQQCSERGGEGSFGFHYFREYKRADQNYANNSMEIDAVNTARDFTKNTICTQVGCDRSTRYYENYNKWGIDLPVSLIATAAQSYGKEWQEYPGTGLAKSLAVSQDGTPVIIGTDNKIYRGSGNGWVELSGTGLAMGIAIDGRGKTWIVGTDQRIYFHNRGSTWQEYPGTGLAKSLTVSQDGTPIIIGTDDKIYKGSGSGWVELSGTGLAVDVAVDGTGKTWIIGTDQRIYFHNGSAWQEYPGTGLAKSIAVSQDGIPVIIGTGDKIYRGSGSGWVELSGTGLAVDVAVDGTGKTWIIGTDQRIYFHL
jgi:Domain of unknown function (DUF4157)